MRKEDPIINVQSPSGDISKVFFNPSDIREWIDAERKAWKWLAEKRRDSPTTRTTIDSHQEALQKVAEALRQYQDGLDKGSDSSKNVRRLQSSVKDLITKFPLSDSASGRFIMSLADDSPDQAAYSFVTICQNALNVVENYNALMGGARAIAFLLGLKETAEAERHALNELKQSLSSAIADEVVQARSSVTSFEREIKNQQGVMVGQHMEFHEWMENRNEEWKQLKDKYDKSLSLQSPVKYWRVKGTIHYWISALAGLSFILIGYALLTLSVDALDNLADQGADIMEPWNYVGLLLLIALGVWGLRLVVRVMISNLHLAADARERATMVLTYLALERHGKGLDKDEKEQIISALFRPASLGSARDDEGPYGNIGMLARVFGGRIGR